jgi:hypothetical protein
VPAPSPRPRSRRSTRPVLAAGAAALLGLVALTVGGCGVGPDAQTNSHTGPRNDAQAGAGELVSRGLVLVMDDTGRASLIGTVVNQGGDADSLTAVEVTGATAALALGTTATTQVALPARTSLQFGYGQRSIVVQGLPPLLGRFVDVTMVYGKAGRATAPVLTVPAAGIYEGLGPATA